MDQANRDTSTPLLGCIADDVTGATDLANNLVLAGMSVIQYFGVPSADLLRQHSCDAIVVALKTRSIEPSDAIRQSTEALDRLRKAGCQRFFFKYCSTFDSTPRGNIGPVADALMDALDTPQTIFCPAFPRAGRAVYGGHLFVGGKLLNQSGMENHPINPMIDSNLVSVLSQQTTRPVGRLGYDDLSCRNDVIEALQNLKQNGISHVVTDSCDDEHLRKIADAVADWPLLTGGSGIAQFLPDAYRRQQMLDDQPVIATLPTPRGRSLIVSGSCSSATNSQVARALDTCSVWSIDVLKIADDSSSQKSQLLSWADQTDPSHPMLLYSTADPDRVQQIQTQIGAQKAAETTERFFGWAASELVNRLDVKQLIVAGGETSGAVIQSLDVDAIRIGPEICAGVPWTETIGARPIALALKSGNFGGENFFLDALEMLS